MGRRKCAKRNLQEEASETKELALCEQPKLMNVCAEAVVTGFTGDQEISPGYVFSGLKFYSAGAAPPDHYSSFLVAYHGSTCPCKIAVYAGDDAVAFCQEIVDGTDGGKNPMIMFTEEAWDGKRLVSSQIRGGEVFEVSHKHLTPRSTEDFCVAVLWAPGSEPDERSYLRIQIGNKSK